MNTSNPEQENNGDLMVLDVEPFNGQFRKGMEALMSEHLPQVHAKSFQHFIKQNEQLKRAYADLEEKFGLLREDKNKVDNKLIETQKDLDKIRLRENVIMEKEVDISKREAAVLQAEMEARHLKEMSDLKIESEKGKVQLLTATIETVFKPHTLRESVHKSVPVKESHFSRYYDSEKGRDVYEKTGEDEKLEPTDETRTTTEE